MTDTAVLPPDLTMLVDSPPLASWSRRVVAALLDDAILGGATWLLLGSGVVAPTLTPGAVLGPSERDGLIHSPAAWLASGLLVGIFLAMVALQGWTGATPGKRVAGVAVVRVSDGVPAGFFASGLRVVAHLIDAIFLIGYLRPLWNARKQTFADSIVGTQAIQTREPPAHPWFARFRRGPSAVGSTAVSVAAVAVCVLGVGFSTASSSWGGQWENPVPCADDRTLVTRTAYADVVRRGGTTQESRLWISRVTDEDVDKDLSITWTWTTPGGAPDALVETTLTRADGSTIEITQDVTTTADLSGAAVFDPASVPASDLREAGPGWTAQTRLVVGGEVVGSCSVDSADWDAAAVPPASWG
ncbi:RDD family protein [Cellulomonas humilata]|uniref:Mce-associated membrane protein n=1 Tax=Cellulomonas humilata TaxID=144055 RepID=A0ABU0EAH2_9CELL|nr:RDD family protein [Cellulomonas humilata]MDQ0372271.1 Mce-associated membrane protein [Cellulomonas humilata]